MTPEQREKLPRFAKEFIKTLEHTIHAQATALEAYSMKTPSKVLWGWDFRGQAWGYLDDNETITFTMLTSPLRQVRVRLKGDNSLNINGDDGLIILPGATNDATVKLRG